MRRLNLSTKLIYTLTVLMMAVPVWMAQGAGRFDEGTIFSFHFDEDDGGEVTDSSGNENHGILGGADPPEWVDGPDARYGGALEFIDCNYIEIPESPNMDTDEEITFETWLNLNSLTSNWSTLYNKGAQSAAVGYHWIFIFKDGKLAYQYVNGSKYVTVGVDVDWEFGRWTHVAITHEIHGNDGGMIKFYIDGQQIHEEEHDDKALPVIGGRASLGTYQMMNATDRYALDGIMDEIRLSPWIKTEAEIMASMDAFAVEPHQKLAGTWGRIKSTD